MQVKNQIQVYVPMIMSTMDMFRRVWTAQVVSR